MLYFVENSPFTHPGDAEKPNHLFDFVCLATLEDQ